MLPTIIVIVIAAVAAAAAADYYLGIYIIETQDAAEAPLHKYNNSITTSSYHLCTPTSPSPLSALLSFSLSSRALGAAATLLTTTTYCTSCLDLSLSLSLSLRGSRRGC